MNPLISPWLRSYLTLGHKAESPLTRQHTFLRHPLRTQTFANRLVQRYVAGEGVVPQRAGGQAAARGRIAAGVTTGVLAPTLSPLPLLTAEVDPMRADESGAIEQDLHRSDGLVTDREGADLPQVVATLAHPAEEDHEESYPVQRSPAQLSAELRKTLRRAQKPQSLPGTAQTKAAGQQPQSRSNPEIGQKADDLPLDTATNAPASTTASASVAEARSHQPAAAEPAYSLVGEIERRIQRVAEQRLLPKTSTSTTAPGDKSTHLANEPTSADNGASLVDEIERRIAQAAQRRLNPTGASATEADDTSQPQRLQRSEAEGGADAPGTSLVGQPPESRSGRRQRNAKIYSQVEELKSLAAEPTLVVPLPPNRARQLNLPAQGSESETEPEQEPQPDQRKEMSEPESLLAGEPTILAGSNQAVGELNEVNSVTDPASPPQVDIGTPDSTMFAAPGGNQLQRAVERQAESLPTALAPEQKPLTSVLPSVETEWSDKDQHSPLPTPAADLPAPEQSQMEGNLSELRFPVENDTSNTGSTSPSAVVEPPNQPPIPNSSAAVAKGVAFSAETRPRAEEEVITNVPTTGGLVDPVGDDLSNSAEPVGSANVASSDLLQKAMAETVLDLPSQTASESTANHPIGPLDSADSDPPVQPIVETGDAIQARRVPEGGTSAMTRPVVAPSDPQSAPGMLPGYSTETDETEPLSAEMPTDFHAARGDGKNERSMDRTAAPVNPSTARIVQAETASAQSAPSGQHDLSSPASRIQRTLAEHKAGIAALLHPARTTATRVARQPVEEPASLPRVLDLATQPLQRSSAKRQQAPPDLDRLARQLTPLVKRLLLVERERDPI